MVKPAHIQKDIGTTGICAPKLMGVLKQRNALSVADFMAFALTDQDTGYYTTTQPLGAHGDFTTSPEISPLFGEIVAAKLIHTWQAMGAPSPFILLELGPGRGTLMADVLRVGRHVPGFVEKAQVRLVEVSPILRHTQKNTLQNLTEPAWFDTLEDALEGPALPLFLLANEFFDALPIHQYEMTSQGWRERGVTLDQNNRLTWCYLEHESPFLPPADTGTMTQTSPQSHALLEKIFNHMSHHQGASFICDYGFIQGWGDTLQGVKDHAYCDVLTHVGACDISAHVDFGRMDAVGRSFPSLIHTLTTQGAFLKENHIEVRAQQLLKSATNPDALLKGLHRLVDDDHMGSLFKVYFSHSPLKVHAL